jgi:hypothetical protein
VLQNSIIALQAQILKLREQLDALKTAIIQGCKDALAAFKEKGAVALDGVARFLRLRPALEKMAGTFERAEQRNARAIGKIEAVSAEYHKAGLHLRNMGRAIAGKEPIPDPKPVGKAAAAISAPFKAACACVAAAWVQAQGALENLDKLEKASDRPEPIKAQFDAAAKQAAAHNNARNTPDRAKPAPAAEL